MNNCLILIRHYTTLWKCYFVFLRHQPLFPGCEACKVLPTMTSKAAYHLYIHMAFFITVYHVTKDCTECLNAFRQFWKNSTNNQLPQQSHGDTILAYICKLWKQYGQNYQINTDLINNTLFVLLCWCPNKVIALRIIFSWNLITPMPVYLHCSYFP